MVVEHEDVVWRKFPYTFIGKASIWFFSLTTRSITYWKQFETTFMTQFGDDKTYGIYFLVLSRIKINKKEKVKDFNQRFITLLNQIIDKLVEFVHIEFYTTSLPPLVAMFVKGKENKTLVENFLEAIKVEKDLAVISSHRGNEKSKEFALDKNIKKSKGISKTEIDNKDKDLMDMERMQRIIKQLTNEIIDLKNKKGDEKKPFIPFFKKKTNIDSSREIPPTSDINLEDYDIENYCHMHHANHSKRTCPKFINYFTTMFLPPEPLKRENKNEKEGDDDEKQEEAKEEEEEEEPPSHLNMIWDETEVYNDDDDIIE
jgi:hypothetical protein